MRPQQSADNRGGIDNELQKLEQEVAGEELGLTREIARIADEVESLRSRLSRTQQNATAAAKAAPDAILTGIQQRSAVELQPMQTDPAHERIRAARRQAVELRRQAVAETRAELQRFADALAQLSQQVETDEAALRQLEQRRREEKERQQQEEELRRSAASAAIAPPAWDVDAEPPFELASPKTPPPAPTAPPAKPPVPKPTAAKPPPSKPANRTVPRVKMQAAVDLESDSNFFQGFSTNISQGGIFVATVNTLPLGTNVDVRFTLPSGQRIDVQGEVRWTREVNDKTPDIFPGVGIQFRGLAPDAEAAIQQFVKGREPLFFPD